MFLCLVSRSSLLTLARLRRAAGRPSGWIRGMIGHVIESCVCSRSKSVDRESLAISMHRPCPNPRYPRDPRMIPLQRIAETPSGSMDRIIGQLKDDSRLNRFISLF
jgi:hypothetical protein